jgi:hypothetical protein
MLILFLKSKPSDDKQLPLTEKLRLIYEARVKEAKTEEDRARAQRDLDKFTSQS